MALRVYLELKANNEQINGENEQSEVGGVDVSKMIEVIDFNLTGAVAFNETTGVASSERRYKPLKFRKAIDQGTPEIAAAFTLYKPIQAKFHFFRTYTEADATGGGESGVVHYFTITASNGRIVSMSQQLPTAFGVEDRSDFGHPIEDIEVAFNSVEWKHEIATKQHSDSWKII
jgi:type VI secretion system Hcp family effector